MNDMVTRIVKGGLVLRDIEWTHETKWGHWDPLDLNGNFSWSDERGLNSLQILAYLATALAHQPSPDSRTSLGSRRKRHVVESHQ